MESEKQVAVYFLNGKRAIFPESEIIVRGGDNPPWDKEFANLIHSGKTVINWKNVCFSRPLKEEDEE